jgi:hypothetical protein
MRLCDIVCNLLEQMAVEHNTVTQYCYLFACIALQVGPGAAVDPAEVDAEMRAAAVDGDQLAVSDGLGQENQAPEGGDANGIDFSGKVEAVPAAVADAVTKDVPQVKKTVKITAQKYQQMKVRLWNLG